MFASSHTLDQWPQTLSASARGASVLETMFLSDGICDYHAIVLIDQPGVSNLQLLFPFVRLSQLFS